MAIYKPVTLPPMFDANRADIAILEMVEQRKKKGIMPLRWHIPYLDNTAHPLYPMWSYLICGRPSSMKSTLLSHLVSRWAETLAEENKDRDLKRVIVFVKPEETVEMARYQTWDEKPWPLNEVVAGKPSADEMKAAIAKQSAPPTIFIGDAESAALLPKSKGGHQPQRYSVEDIDNACDALVSGNMFYEQCEIACIVVDGLYLIDNRARSRDRLDRMADVPDEINMVARKYAAPLVASTQAIQKGAYNKADSVPRMDDVMWNSTVSQSFWAFMGIERPSKRPGLTLAFKDDLNGWQGDFEDYSDEKNKSYSVPVTLNLATILVDKFRGTRNCESRRIAVWAEDDGRMTQKYLPNFAV